jgi:hypothetical protein
MKKLFLVALIAAALSACTSADTATRALRGAGYTNIQTTGYRFFGCSEDDAFRTGFTATGPSGQAASGVVCSGWLKGATIRTD